LISVSGRILEEKFSGGGGAGKQGGFQEGDEISLEALGGMDEGEIDGQGVGAAIGTVAEDELAEDHWVAQRLFGIVISRRHVVDVEESKEPVPVAFWIEEALAQVFDFWMLARCFTDALQGGLERWAFGLCLGEGKLAGVAEAADFTSFGKEGGCAVTKTPVGGMLQGFGQESDGLIDFVGFTDEVREAGLAAFGLDEVIGGIVIGHQVALEAGAEDAESHVAGAGAVDVEKAEVGIAGEPDVSALSINAPVGLIGMDDIGAANLVA